MSKDYNQVESIKLIQKVIQLCGREVHKITSDKSRYVIIMMETLMNANLNVLTRYTGLNPKDDHDKLIGILQKLIKAGTIENPARFDMREFKEDNK